MSVVLTKEQIESILSLYHLDAPEAFGGSSGGASSYWVVVQGTKYFLRLSHRRSIDDMVFEKELLLHCLQVGLRAPRLMQNVAKGTFTPWARRGRFVSLFIHPEGRTLGRFEIRPEHAAAVGDWLGRLHDSTRAFSRFKRPELGEPGPRLDRLERALERRRLARRHADAVARLRGFERSLRAWPSLPLGVTHQGLSLDHVLFHRGALAGVVGFDHAAVDAQVRDLAMAIHEWTWVPSAEGRSGPHGAYDRKRVRALLHGYRQHRSLTDLEQRALPDVLVWTAVREAARRLVEHELKRSAGVPYEDHRHYLARLEALARLGPYLTAPR